MCSRQDILDINESAKRAFGDDMSIMVARAPSFGCGDTDVCYLVWGKKRRKCAEGLALYLRNAKITNGGKHLIVEGLPPVAKAA